VGICSMPVSVISNSSGVGFRCMPSYIHHPGSTPPELHSYGGADAASKSKSMAEERGSPLAGSHLAPSRTILDAQMTLGRLLYCSTCEGKSTTQIPPQ
jgi:hypothetical protein